MACIISINQVFCLVQLTSFILKGMNKCFHTGLILVYLQKVFDALDQTLPLQKIECTGSKKPLIKWFQSHLSNRKFSVTLEDIFCFFRCWTNKLWCLTRVYLRAAPFPNMYKQITTGI